MQNNTFKYTITEEEHHWTSEEKIKWLGYGEWVEEADSVEFEYLGYTAIVTRIVKREPFAKEEAYFGGHLCGYVQIPEDHPAYKDKMKISYLCSQGNIQCHGGITFNEYHEKHLIGFDCGHSGDYMPTMELTRKKIANSVEFADLFSIPEELMDCLLFNPVYRNMDYCIKECMVLIEQLNEFAMETNEAKKSIQDEINDFLALWGFEQITNFLKDLFPLLDLYNVDEGDDWLKDLVEEDDVRTVRLVRTVYLMSKICEFHGNRMSSTNNNFKHLWRRMEEYSLHEN